MADRMNKQPGELRNPERLFVLFVLNPDDGGGPTDGRGELIACWLICHAPRQPQAAGATASLLASGNGAR